MILASVNNNTIFLHSSTLTSSQTKHFLSTHPPTCLSLPRVPLSRSVVSLARRRSNSGRPTSSKKKKSQSRNREGLRKEDDLDEDAFEALFKRLEEDLRRDEKFMEGDGEISEEDLALLERELEEALSEEGLDMSELLNMTADIVAEERGEEEDLEDEGGEEDEEEVEEDADDYDDEEEEPIKLRGWQLRRLAQALKVGRRKTNIKNLAADLCLDRAVVLELLREPPPELLMMSASLSDKPEPSITTPDPEETPSLPSEVITDSAKSEPKPKEETPIHVLQGSWSAQKRLKKAQVDTLESVYRRTKRPTNAMISSIVHVTNLPRKRVVKWFEDKRATDGVPEQRSRYQRSSSEPAVTQYEESSLDHK